MVLVKKIVRGASTGIRYLVGWLRLSLLMTKSKVCFGMLHVRVELDAV